MHQAQPKEGHKIWLTQEADAKSWSSLKHVQPKEGRKELAPREIKFRYRRLDTTIRERAGSSQVPREAQESQRYPGLLLFVSFFSFFFSCHCDSIRETPAVPKPQERRKRAKDTPGYYSLFLFSLLYSYSRCSRQKSSRHGRDESRQESHMVQNRERQPHNQLRLFVNYL